MEPLKKYDDFVNEAKKESLYKELGISSEIYSDILGETSAQVEIQFINDNQKYTMLDIQDLAEDILEDYIKHKKIKKISDVNFGNLLADIAKRVKKSITTGSDEYTNVTESRVTYKRRYTENHPARITNENTKIRNKVLSTIGDKI